MSLTLSDLSQQRPSLLTSDRIIGLSTDSNPTVGGDGGALLVGQEWVHEDTGVIKYYTGSGWVLVDFNQRLNQGIALLMEIRDLLNGES